MDKYKEPTNIANYRANDWVNVRDYLATHAANLLFSQGIKIMTDDEAVKAFIEEFIDHNNLERKLWYYETLLSKNGRIILCLEKDAEGKIDIVAVPYTGMSKVLYARREKTRAVIVKVIPWENTTKQMVVVYDEKNVTKTVVDDADAYLEGTNLATYSVAGTTGVEPHGFNGVPVFEIFNKYWERMEIGDWIKNDFKFLSDSSYCETLAKQINLIFETMAQEGVLNKTRVLGKFDEAFLARLRTDKHELAPFIDQVFIQTMAGKENPITVMEANPKFEVYMQQARELLSEYFHYSGYSGREDKAAQQTQMETIYTQKQDIITTKVKRDARTRDYTQILDMILEEAGIQGEWTLEITDAMIESESIRIDNHIKKIQNGLGTREQAVADLEKCTMKEAEEIVAMVDSKLEEQAKKDMELMGQEEEEKED